MVEFLSRGTETDLSGSPETTGRDSPSGGQGSKRSQSTEVSGSMTFVIELKVAKSDVGKLIGRQGRTADAIRTLMNCAAAKLNKRYMLEIIEP